MSDNLINQLESNMRGRRAAERNEVVVRLKTYLETIDAYEREVAETRKLCEDLMLAYVVDRLSKGDKEGVTIFRNSLPPALRAPMDRILEIYEIMYGKPPTY